MCLKIFFFYKKSSISTLSGLRHDRRHVIILPSALKSLFDGTLVAGTHRYRQAKLINLEKISQVSTRPWDPLLHQLLVQLSNCSGLLPPHDENETQRKPWNSCQVSLVSQMRLLLNPVTLFPCNIQKQGKQVTWVWTNSVCHHSCFYDSDVVLTDIVCLRVM